MCPLLIIFGTHLISYIYIIYISRIASTSFDIEDEDCLYTASPSPARPPLLTIQLSRGPSSQESNPIIKEEYPTQVTTRTNSGSLSASQWEGASKKSIADDAEVTNDETQTHKSKTSSEESNFTNTFMNLFSKRESRVSEAEVDMMNQTPI